MGIMRITHISVVQHASTRLKTAALGGRKTQRTSRREGGRETPRVRRWTCSFTVLIIISSLKLFDGGVTF